MNLEAGQQLLQYRLVEKIGEGGMGVVWRALDTTLGREVAIEAMRLGVEVIAVDRYAQAPAMQVAHHAEVIDMLDGDALRAVITRHAPHLVVPEVEAIATDTLVALEAEGVNVVPTARATRLTMDREGIRRLAAEELGLVNELGALMLTHAARAYHACARADVKLDHIVVNMSPAQFADAGVADRIIALRNELELPWGALVLEITEHVLLDDNIADVPRAISRMRAHGIKFIIDDFGTRNASIEYLKHLDVDGIKIDRSFVRDMVANKRDHGLVNSMFNMAHELDLQIVSEGGETRSQLEALRELGCSCFQGFYFSEAVNLDRLLRLLQTPRTEHWLAERRRVAN